MDKEQFIRNYLDGVYSGPNGFELLELDLSEIFEKIEDLENKVIDLENELFEVSTYDLIND